MQFASSFEKFQKQIFNASFWMVFFWFWFMMTFKVSIVFSTCRRSLDGLTNIFHKLKIAIFTVMNDYYPFLFFTSSFVPLRCLFASIFGLNFLFETSPTHTVWVTSLIELLRINFDLILNIDIAVSHKSE